MGTICKPQKAARFPQKPHPTASPSVEPTYFAAGTDESIIVGYYTSAEVLSAGLAVSIQTEITEVVYGKK